MHFTTSIYLKPVTITLFVLTLSGCGTLQTIYDDAPTLFETSKKTEVNPLLQKLRALDLANDREAARNTFMKDMITSSDRLCDKQKQQILHDSQQWDIDSEKGDRQFEDMLKEAIDLRQYDHTNPGMTLLSKRELATPERAMATVIIKNIEETRKLARIQLKSRMEEAIRQYSVKQGLLDLQAYHNSCSIHFAAGSMAIASTVKMTPAERNASIEDLMQLRQKLMDEGLNARAVEQKIDALILDH